MQIKLHQSQIIQNVLKLILGTGTGQLVTLLSAPFIARLYSPQSFGEQAALFSIVGPLVTITSMAFPIAIVVARTDIEALGLERLAFWGSVAIAPIATAALLVNNMWLLTSLGLEEVGPYAILIPFIAVLTTINMCSGYILTRNGAFNLAAWSQTGSSILGNLSKLTLGMVWPSALSLIAGNSIGYLVAPLMALRLKRNLAAKPFNLSFKQLRAIAYRYWDFALLRAPQNFLAAISQSLPLIGLTASFGPKAAGFYAVANIFTGAPVSLIGNAVQTVLYPRLTEDYRAGKNVSKLLLKSTALLIMVGSPLFAIIAIFGPQLFAVILGTAWKEAGVYSALLTPFLLLGLANRPAVSLIPIIGLQRGLLIYEIIGTIAKIAALMVGHHAFASTRWTVGLFSAVGTFSYLLLIAWVAWSSHKGVQRYMDEKTS